MTDDRDVFIVQLEGRKHWKIYGSPIPLPYKVEPVNESPFSHCSESPSTNPLSLIAPIRFKPQPQTLLHGLNDEQLNKYDFAPMTSLTLTLTLTLTEG